MNDADCSSWVISDGDYTGGQLWVEHPEGIESPPPELWRTPNDENLRGRFPVEQWLKKYPDSIYNVSQDTFQTLVEEFPTVEPGEPRGANSVEVEPPQALAIQELQALPKDVDRHFSELAKAHPISMKAVRNTEGKEREKWKESMGKELKGLVDRETCDEVSSSDVPLSQVQNAPARMVYVVKPAIADDGTRFVKRTIPSD
eukprot:6491400-Amphidinium_carterae.1